jgi:hypothetical protein
MKSIFDPGTHECKEDLNGMCYLCYRDMLEE